MKTKEIVSHDLSDIQLDPLSFLEKLVEAEGDIVLYKVNGELTLLINDPQIIKRVLVSENKYFVKEGTPEMFILRPILGEGMLTSDGDTWKKQRTEASPHFSHRNILTFVKIMINETKVLLDSWSDKLEIDLELEMSQLTLQIVGKALFGDGLAEDSDKFSEGVKTVNQFMGHYDPFDFEGRMNFIEAIDHLRSYVLEIIKTRRASKEDHNDFLDVLLAAYPNGAYDDDQKLIDQIFTFLMAGHETTAKSLTWTLYELSQNKLELTQLENDVDNSLGGNPPEIGNLHDLDSCWRVIQEGMRLNPPVWVISRKAFRDEDFNGIRIPAGTTVLVSPYLIHRNEKYWSEPELFKPDRFKIDDVNERPDYSFIPFSAGPRRCIGMNFANQEMIIVLSMILQRYRLELKPGFKVEREALVTLRPKNGMLMTIRQREKKNN